MLIIEDEPMIAMMLQDLLEEEGATSISTAMTEREAVEAALLTRPDIITADVRLLEGTGPGAVKSIERLYGEIPVIFITGTPWECEPLSVSSVVLAKPVSLNKVAAAFHRATQLD